jgi:hypothetical protein
LLSVFSHSGITYLIEQLRFQSGYEAIEALNTSDQAKLSSLDCDHVKNNFQANLADIKEAMAEFRLS